MSEGIDLERKSLGLAVRTSDPMSNVSGDEQLFKSFLVKPVEPMTTANFERSVTTIDEEGKPIVKTESFKRNVPMLSSTMALGHLNIKEVNLARIYTEMSRKCAWFGYFDLAITYYLKVVHLNVTSQSFQSQLLSQILTETVSVLRKEETLAGTRDYTNEKSNKVQEFIDKWKQKDANGQQTQSGGIVQSGTQHFGLR